jgi:Formamidopyrimidine-DNA glycosylase
MPEGPEIKRAADRLANALVSKRLVNIYFFSERLKKYESILEGAKVNSIRKKGKALLPYLDSGHAIYSPNQLYGQKYFARAGNLPLAQQVFEWRSTRTPNELFV